MIKLLLIGHLGKDAVVNNVNGKSVINFNVAHSEKWKDGNGVQQEKTQWIQCAYWTDRTAVAPYLKKGTQVYVEGTPDVRQYEVQGGDVQATMTLRVFSVQLLSNKQSNAMPGNANASETAPIQSSYPNASDISAPVDDLPF